MKTLRIPARQRNDVGGHIRWRRFGATLALATLAAGGLSIALAQGALAASFAVSGATFKINATDLTGSGVALYGSGVQKTDSTGAPVATMGLRSIKIDNFCSTLVARNIPVIGTVTVKLATPAAVTGENVMLDVDTLDSSTLALTNAQLGRDASTLSAGPSGAVGTAGSTGLQADKISAHGLGINAWALSAGTLSLNGLHLSAHKGEVGC